MEIRLAEYTELDEINVLRKQVNDLHSKEKPEFFKEGFSKELQDFLFDIWNNEKCKIVVAIDSGRIIGYSIFSIAHKKETLFMRGRDYLDIDEICVDKDHRRQGVASSIMKYIENYAKEIGIKRIELNMWEFNEEALSFYEKSGFKTYRRYLERCI